MRLITFEAEGAERFGAECGEYFVDLALAAASIGGDPPAATTLAAFLSLGPSALESARRVLRSIEERLRAGSADDLAGDRGGLFRAAASRRLAPIPRPGKILAVGRNYADHCAEQNRELPERPLYFVKLSTSVIADRDPIAIPREVTQEGDYEAELAVILGRGGRDIPEGRALEHVAGYTILNDVTARDLQRAEKQWSRAKGLDTFCPMGPALVTTDEIPDPHRLAIRCTVNGETRQSSNTRHLVFRIPELLSRLSLAITLEPGDVLSTGTPGGVGAYMDPPRFLREGDVVRVDVEGIGRLENPVREA
jgi:2-keto-4-pentenoate hydratase/2-oxohepta-3-ene-1,7-dioic acid hydratase in catechol pathway